METMTKRQVGQTPALLWATAIRCAEEGQELYILEKGRPAYHVEYVGDGEDPLAEMERQGIYTPPSAAPRPAPVLEPAYTTAEVEAILDELRGDR